MFVALSILCTPTGELKGTFSILFLASGYIQFNFIFSKDPCSTTLSVCPAPNEAQNLPTTKEFPCLWKHKFRKFHHKRLHILTWAP